MRGRGKEIFYIRASCRKFNSCLGCKYDIRTTLKAEMELNAKSSRSPSFLNREYYRSLTFCYVLTPGTFSKYTFVTQL